MNFQTGTANVTISEAPMALPREGWFSLFPFQTALGMPLVLGPSIDAPAGQLRFDRGTIAQAQARPLETGDPLGFNYYRMLAGEASAVAGRHRPLSDVMNELRARHR